MSEPTQPKTEQVPNAKESKEPTPASKDGERQPADLSIVVDHIRRRARVTRRFAKGSIYGIVVTVGAMIMLFYGSGPFFYDSGMSEFRLEILTDRFERLDEKDPNLLPTLKAIEQELGDLALEIKKERAGATSSLIFGATYTVIRIGSVFLAIYLIQILVGFTRYQFRVADHLDATADAMEVVGLDPDALSKVMSVFAPQHIEFGKMPRTMTDQGTELLRELVAKLPSR